MICNQISQKINVFHGRKPPEDGLLVGYGALVEYFNLQVPLPEQLALISQKHRKYHDEGWKIFTPRYTPVDNLAGHLTFALKYEGVDLHVLKSLFERVGKTEIETLVTDEPTGKYSRRIWFLYEWLLDTHLDIPDLKTGNFADLLDPEIQYPGPVVRSKRHRIRNNLPGVKNFCPLIRRTKKLDAFLAEKPLWNDRIRLKDFQKDILRRVSAFLLLKDSKASFAIEGETPAETRAFRWGKAIGEAGQKTLDKEDLLKLQQLVIENNRFVKMGWRTQGGFVGEHDRTTGAPIPEHISAKQQDVGVLIDGLIEAAHLLEGDEFDPVFAAALIAFGFVFIHPFVDGNGRIHRYLVHHILARKNFGPKGIIFPISAAILQKMDDYRRVLESYSHPRLQYIDWKQTPDHNVEVLNETIDLYRYFDATKQAEFLCDCVRLTLSEIIPAEVRYLQNYDRFKAGLYHRFELPDPQVALLIRFLEQGNGKLSNRAKQQEFKQLDAAEIHYIETLYAEVF